MLTLFNKKPLFDPSEATKITEKFLSYLDSQFLVTVAPLINKTWNTQISSQPLKQSAETRIEIYQSTLKPCPDFKSENPDSFSYSRLSGGFTNITYKLLIQNNSFFISRVPGRGSHKFIDRKSELYNAKIASQVGVNPVIAYGDEKTGAMLSKYIQSPIQMTPELLREDPNKIDAITHSLKSIHHCELPFANSVDVFKQSKNLLALLNQRKVKLPDSHDSLMKLMDDLENIFQPLPIVKVPCHNDTVFSNFIFGENKMWIIDWEYSGNNDPMWDLSYLSKLTEFTPEQDQRMLSTYFGCADYENKFAKEYQRFIAYKPIADYFVFLWAHVQLANKNTSATPESFTHMADQALTSCLQLIEEDKFKSAISELQEKSPSNPNCQKSFLP